MLGSLIVVFNDAELDNTPKVLPKRSKENAMISTVNYRVKSKGSWIYAKASNLNDAQDILSKNVGERIDISAIQVFVNGSWVWAI